MGVPSTLAYAREECEMKNWIVNDPSFAMTRALTPSAAFSA